MKYLVFIFSVLIFVSLGTIGYVFSSNVDNDNANVDGYAWSPNFGWVSFHGDNYRTNIVDGIFDDGSYAWSPNFGWIAFGGEQLGGCPENPCVAKITQVGTQRFVTGWAKIITSGEWLSLSGKTTDGKDYGVVIDQQGAFSGYAWGNQTAGWLGFSGVTTNGENFGVYTNPLSIDDVRIAGFAVVMTNKNVDLGGKIISASQDCAFYAEPSSVAEYSKSTLYWFCQNVSSCSLEGVGGVSAPTGSLKVSPGKEAKIYLLTCQGAPGSKTYTVEVKVIKTTIKEVRPY